MKSTIPRFNAQRMLMDYVRKLYWPARQQRRRMEANGAELERRLAAWKRRVRAAWPGVSVDLMLQPPAHLYCDEEICLRVRADLNGLEAGDVRAHDQGVDVVGPLVGVHDEIFPVFFQGTAVGFS